MSRCSNSLLVALVFIFAGVASRSTLFHCSVIAGYLYQVGILLSFNIYTFMGNPNQIKSPLLIPRKSLQID